jgi:hypothetical protein
MALAQTRVGVLQSYCANCNSTGSGVMIFVSPHRLVLACTPQAECDFATTSGCHVPTFFRAIGCCNHWCGCFETLAYLMQATSPFLYKLSHVHVYYVFPTTSWTSNKLSICMKSGLSYIGYTGTLLISCDDLPGKLPPHAKSRTEPPRVQQLEL